MELIDKKPLIRHLVDWQMEQFAEVGHEREFNLLDLIIKGIENEPTVEAKEVVHGKWIPYTISKLFSHTCSICHCDVEEKTPFCPNCGADMRTSAE